LPFAEHGDKKDDNGRWPGGPGTSSAFEAPARGRILRQNAGKWCFLLALLAVGSGARAANVMTSINSGSNGDDLAQALEQAWNQAGYACRTGSPILYVTAEVGTCDWHETSALFELTSGMTTAAAHTVEFHVNCAGTTLQQSIGFDGGALQPIDSGVFVFNLSGGDTWQITTTEYQVQRRRPALSPAGLAAALIALLLGSSALILRRRRRAARA